MFSAMSHFIILLPDVVSCVPVSRQNKRGKIFAPTSPQVDFSQRAECKHRRHGSWGKKGVSVELACLIEINLASRWKVSLRLSKRIGQTRKKGMDDVSGMKTGWENCFLHWRIQAASSAIRTGAMNDRFKKLLLDNWIHFSSFLTKNKFEENPQTIYLISTRVAIRMLSLSSTTTDKVTFL